METNKAKEISIYLAEDTERAKEVLAMQPEDAWKRMTADGLDVSLNEIIEFGGQLRNAVPENGELNVEELENVAGGFGVVATLVACGIGGAIIGVAVNAPW